MFSTLTEEDLQVLGITAFGPRKKLLMAINFLSTHHHSHGHLSPQIYHHHQPHNQFMQTASMGGRLCHGPPVGRAELKNPPGIPAGFEQKIQQTQQQSSEDSAANKGSQNQSREQGNQELQNKASPGPAGGGGGTSGGQEGTAGNVPPKFSGSAAPGAERRTSNSS